LYPSPNIIRTIKSRRIRWAELVASIEKMRNASRIFVGKPEGKGPIVRPRRKWEDNIKMDLGATDLEGTDWIHLTSG
jgi:hypothetical protein